MRVAELWNVDCRPIHTIKAPGPVISPLCSGTDLEYVRELSYLVGKVPTQR